MDDLDTSVTLAGTLRNAAIVEERFLALVRDLPRTPKGVRASEMLFACAAVAGLRPRRFLESGTAGGQSTLQLALFFPEAEIISLDLDAGGDDARAARARLGGLDNVRLLHGDARRILPGLLAPGDVVLIDGPKGYRALRFAFELLLTGKPSAVFVHDLTLGLGERVFLERHLPHAFFSDHPAFVARHRYLDTQRKQRPAAGAADVDPEPQTLASRPYGATFGCIPSTPRVSPARYRYLIFKRAIWRLAARACPPRTG